MRDMLPARRGALNTGKRLRRDQEQQRLPARQSRRRAGGAAAAAVPAGGGDQVRTYIMIASRSGGSVGAVAAAGCGRSRSAARACGLATGGAAPEARAQSRDE